MNILDMRTVLFSYVITSALCATVMASLWWQNRSRFPGLIFWLIGFIMQFVALVLIILRGILPDFLSMVVSNTMIFVGTLLLYIGLERYVGKNSPQWYNFLYLIAFITTHMYFVYVQPSLLTRNINAALGLLVISLQCALLLLFRVEPSSRSELRPAGVFLGAFGLVSLGRIIVDLSAPPGNDLFKSGLYDTMVILTYQMLYIGLTFTLFLMVNQRLTSALESDIQERKQTEESLKKSQEKFLVAFQNIPDALVITSLTDSEIIEANESFFRMSGFSKEESLGNTTIGLNLWGNLDHRNRLVVNLQKHQRVMSFETIFRKKTGELIDGLISSELIQLHGQTCVLNVIRDITERKRTDEQIQRLSKFPAENPNPVMRIDQAGRILYANQSSAPLLATWEREMGQDMPDDWRKQITTVFQTEHSREVEMDCQGRLFSLYLVSVPGEGYINIYGRDITERKRVNDILKSYSEHLEKEVAQRTRELRDAQEQLVRQERLATMGRLAGSIGHELRNPLGVISNAVYYLKISQDNMNDEVTEYLDIIENETRTSIKIISDLLDYARIKSLNREPREIQDLINQALERYPPEPSVKVTIESSSQLQPIFVDPQHIVQVLGNLVLNACQAMPKGGDLTFFARQEQQMIAISVQDTGEGIPQDNMNKLFEPLFTTKTKGLGLGLAVCRNLIEANGGYIEAHSELGKGSTFTIFLPLYVEQV